MQGVGERASKESKSTILFMRLSKYWRLIIAKCLRRYLAEVHRSRSSRPEVVKLLLNSRAIIEQEEQIVHTVLKRLLRDERKAESSMVLNN